MNENNFSFIAKKIGMTNVFNEQASNIPVTVLTYTKHTVVRIKNQSCDGYDALLISTGNEVKDSKINKSNKSLFHKSSTPCMSKLYEVRLNSPEQPFVVGSVLAIENLAIGTLLTVRGVSKGKGFAGTVKKYGFATQDASHGNSRSHRVPGSTGQRQTPGRVFIGKKMPGQMGNKISTVEHIPIFQIDPTRNIIVLQGSIPGAPGSYVTLTTKLKQISEMIFKN
ncbi:MAG: 50S ribosomal protein L3 [Methylacidiphilales bacterium]|nr:50S ribosomal protein L3 [Candidatus Methylacidiphilales bacterium]